MKGKLNKVANGYVLLVDNIMYATDNDKLHKQNCDEIFGAFDVEKLKSDYIEDQLKGLDKEGYEKYFCFAEADAKEFIKGFNKAMELNKDKLFTEDDVISAIVHHTYLLHNDGKGYEDGDDNDDRIDYVIEALKQQPTEIEVEIEMKKVVDEIKVIGAVKGVKSSGDKITTYKTVPKLDENGCLILRKI